MSEPKKRATDGGFRALLVLGAVISIVIAVWGLLWTGMLESVLGLEVPGRAYGLARLYGGTMLAIGIGYGLAAAQPHRSRSLLVPLFVVPLVTAATVISSVARGDIQGGRGWAFAIYNLAFCFLYFRLYPRVQEPETATPAKPPTAPPPDASPRTP